MDTPHRSARRVTGRLKLIQLREGPVWYARTRVPGRTQADSAARPRTCRRQAPPGT